MKNKKKGWPGAGKTNSDMKKVSNKSMAEGEEEEFIEIVINGHYGAFSLSEAGVMHYAQLAGIRLTNDKGVYHNEHGDVFWSENIERNDQCLVQTIYDLGKKANGPCCHLKVVQVPEDVDWIIQQLDGVEWVAERGRTWR